MFLQPQEKLPARQVDAPPVKHPLVDTGLIGVEMEWDEETRCWVTYVPELNGASTFGATVEEALDQTADMIMGWIRATLDAGLKLPISRRKVRQLRDLLEK